MIKIIYEFENQIRDTGFHISKENFDFHELTLFLRYAQDSPSLLRKEVKVTDYKIIIAP
jgi:hypothetical protein